MSSGLLRGMMRRSRTPRSNFRGQAPARSLALFAVALCAAVVSGIGVSGCGSSSGGDAAAARSGAAVVSVTWPDRSQGARLIPVAANSITVSFVSGTTVVATQTVARPSSGNSSTLTFASLPATALTLTARAFPTTDGTGVAQASATESVTIVANATTALAITMASTISSLAISPPAPIVSVGKTIALTVTATDSSGATVLLSNSTIGWSSAAPSVATVSSTGVVTGVASGTSIVTVTESESGKSASVTVTVALSGAATVIVN